MQALSFSSLWTREDRAIGNNKGFLNTRGRLTGRPLSLRLVSIIVTAFIVSLPSSSAQAVPPVAVPAMAWVTAKLGAVTAIGVVLGPFIEIGDAVCPKCIATGVRGGKDAVEWSGRQIIRVKYIGPQSLLWFREYAGVKGNLHGYLVPRRCSSVPPQPHGIEGAMRDLPVGSGGDRDPCDHSGRSHRPTTAGHRPTRET